MGKLVCCVVLGPRLDTCGQCATKFKVKDEFAGKTTKCPTCKRGLKVPTIDLREASSSRSWPHVSTGSANVPPASLDDRPWER